MTHPNDMKLVELKIYSQIKQSDVRQMESEMSSYREGKNSKKRGRSTIGFADDSPNIKIALASKRENFPYACPVCMSYFDSKYYFE